MIRDLMVGCVESRFAAPRAPHPVQWLADNGSVYAAAKTIEIATALNLQPCFTPVESPQSNGVAEAFVKTFKRDYVRPGQPYPRRPGRARGRLALDDRLQRGPLPQLHSCSLTAHQRNTSELNRNLPRVRSNRVNSTARRHRYACPACTRVERVI